MASWIVRWNFDRDSYKPGESALVSFWLENTGNTYFYLSELALKFGFGTYNLKSISGVIHPRENKFLGNVRLLLPGNTVGRKLFALKYHLHDYINNNWVDLGYFQSRKEYFISVYPTPLYAVFISRGLRTEDKAIGDPIAKMVREWGFRTITIGIESKVSDDQVPLEVREKITRANAVIAIATPRFVDALTGLWKTLEWHHAEVGIAFGIDKPLLILKDDRVVLAGLPSYLAELKQAPVIEFDPYDLDSLQVKLSALMPDFRESIETKKMTEFRGTLGKVIVGGLAVVGVIAIIRGIVGALSGTSKK